MYTGIGAFIQIIEFETEANLQQALVKVLIAETERWIRLLPGFVASTFHTGLDGRSVMLSVRWSGQGALDAFRHHAEFGRLTAAVHKVHPKGDPRTRSYHVTDSVGAPFID